MASATPADPAPAAEKKSLFETVVISTPVMLTVIATFILGRSTSEMTQAQYQRSVAGQNQAKVGDQWAFFQAKRIRGTSYETTAVSLFAQKADPFTTDTLVDAAEGFLREIQLTDKEAGTLHDPLETLGKKAKACADKINTVLRPTQEEAKQRVKQALDAFQAYPSPPPDKTEAEGVIDADQRKLLDEVLDDVRKFKPEQETAPKTLKLNAETIDKALERAKAKSAAVAAHGKQIDAVLQELDALVAQQVGLCREYQRLLGGYLSQRVKTGADADEIARLERRLERVRNLSARLLGDYKAARYTFDARRYEDDARANQEQAFLYEVQVLQSSARSDKHLKRSLGFMIAMLVAQVGVTIGSLALMLKFRFPAWILAAFSGLCAIAFGVYILLELGPFLW
jgi:Domain of unknown function (DUF4337)